jgi:ABC-type bacteriocin/lantibiotic exporter with double-glycine peptidase domain
MSGAEHVFKTCALFADAGGVQSVEGIARSLSMRVRRVRLRGAWWRRDAGPLLAYRGGKPVALIPKNAGNYDVLDPIEGTRQTVHERTAAGIGPDAYILYDSLTTQSVSPMQLLLSAVRGSRADILRVVALAGAAGLLGLLPPVLTAWLAGSVIPMHDGAGLAVVSGALITSAICSALLNLSSGLTLQRIGIRASNTALSSIWDRLLALPASFFRQFTPADLAMRVVGMDRIREPLAGPMAAGAVACVFSAFHIVLLTRFAPALALPAATLAAAVGVVSVLCGWLAVRRQREVVAFAMRIGSMFSSRAESWRAAPTRNSWSVEGSS